MSDHGIRNRSDRGCTAALFRLLGDDARLRILRLLDAERLNVTELTSILGIAQSGVSRHLGLLKDAGLVEERRDAGFTFFQLAPGARERARTASGRSGRCCSRTSRPRRKPPKGRADDGAARGSAPGAEGELRRARRRRRARPDRPRPELGRLGARARAPAAAAGSRGSRVRRRLPDVEAEPIRQEGHRGRPVRGRARARQGACGAARPPKRVGGPAPKRAARSGNVEWKRGELEKLPLKDASVDVALLSQALHHADDPRTALAEAVRIVQAPAGACCCSSCAATRKQWVRDRLGDKWLGFEDEELKRLMESAGLTGVKVTVGARRARDPFTVLIASGVKTACFDRSRRRTPRHAR